MRHSLLAKLLAINLLAILVIIVTVWLAVDYFAGDYFMSLMQNYGIEPIESHRMFVTCIRKYLIWGSLVAFFLAVGFSFFLTRHVLRPLKSMAQVSTHISEGNYSGRVPVKSKDEIGKLARTFNSMVDNLNRIEQLRKTMLIDVAHELRTPLTNIRGYIEGLQDGVVPTTSETYDLLLEETSRLVMLIEDVLHLARADAARNTIQKERIDINEMVEECLEPHLPLFQENDMEITTSFDPRKPVVRADPHALDQVIKNLLKNAAQYGAGGKFLHIETKLNKESVKVNMVNDADSLKESDLTFLFERFYRGEKSRSRELGGSGVGLAIVKGFIEAHKGQVGAELKDSHIHIWFTLPV